MIGENWEIKADTLASNGKYVMVKTGLNSVSAAPADSAGTVYFPFTVYGDSAFYIFARLNCPTGNDDSYWVKMDDGEFVKVDALRTNWWQWLKLSTYNLTQGDHRLAVGYCEDGAKLDKICISSYDYTPAGISKSAINICYADTTTSVLNLPGRIDGYTLEQNYPNPFNPTTTISFSVPTQSYVSLKIFDSLGREMSVLLSEKLSAGTYSRQWDAAGLSSGVYFYRLSAVPSARRDLVPISGGNGQAGSFMETKKLILLG